MRGLFLLLCLALSAHMLGAAFSYVSTNVWIYADHEGNAHVIEKITLHIDDENSANVYDSNIEITNDITSWRSRTGISGIRYHINPNVAPISNLRIIPLPKKRMSLINPSYEVVLQIEYDARGLFNRTNVKARTYDMTLKRDALYFSFNPKNDVVLEDTDYLYIILPQNVEAVAVNPLAQNLDVLSRDSKEFHWKGKTILQDFTFKYRYEETLKTEVEEYFSALVGNVRAFTTSQEGIYFFIMLFVIFVSYLLLKMKQE